MHRVDKAAGVDRTISIARNALAGHLACHPIALIGAAIGIGDLAFAVGFARLEISLIDRAIGKLRAPLALDLACDPFAGVFIAIGQAIGAGAVLQPVLEGAFINAAVIILLGDHVAVALGKCCSPERPSPERPSPEDQALPPAPAPLRFFCCMPAFARSVLRFQWPRLARQTSVNPSFPASP